MINNMRFKKTLVTISLLYFIILMYMMFSDNPVFSHLSLDEYVEIHVNLVPFATIGEYIHRMVDQTINLNIVIKNVLGNILLFLPMGVLLPMLFSPLRNLKSLAVSGISISIFVEIIQLVTKRGSLDIDDVILRSIGLLIGYLLYKRVSDR